MIDLSERIRRLCVEQGWESDTLLALALQFIARRKLSQEWEEFCTEVAEEENGPATTAH